MATETLQVILSANAAAFARGMDAAGKSVEQAGKKVSEFGGKLAGVSAAITGFGGLMANEAAKYDGTVNRAVTQLKGAYSALAVEVGRALVPAIKELSHFVSGLVHMWRGMNPEVREAIAHYGGLAASIAAVVGVGAKVTGLGMQFAGLALQVAPVALAVAAIGIAAAVVYKIWKSNVGGMRDWAKSLFQSIRDWLSGVPGWFNTAFQLAKLPLLMFGRALQKALGFFDKGKPGSLSDTLREAMDSFEKAGLGDMLHGAAAALKESGVFIKDAVVDGAGDAIALLKAGMGDVGKAFSKGLVSVGGGISDPGNGRVASGLAGPKGTMSAGVRALTDAGNAVRWVPPRLQAMSVAIEATTHTIEKANERAKKELEARQALAKSLTADKLGQRGGAVLQGATQGAAATGSPWGAVIGAVAALLSQTQAFSNLIKQIEDGLGFIVDALEPLLAPMVVVGQLANDLLGAFGPLVDAFKLIGHAALFMTKATMEVAELILTGMRDVANAMGLEGVATYINVNLLTPVSKAAMSARSAMDKLAASGTKAATANNAAANAGAAMAKSWAEELTNVPTGYKVSAARYGAADLGGTSGGMLPGGGGPVIEVNISGDLAPLVERVETSQKKKSYRRTGSNYANNGKPVRGGDD